MFTCPFFYFLVTALPNIPLPCSSIDTFESSFAVYIPLPTRSVGSLVAATPSESNLALMIKSSPLHQTSSLSATTDAPSGVSHCDDKSKSNGNVGLANRADNTGGALPLLPSNTALGTLSGLFGLAVTYKAAFDLISSMDIPDCNVAVPLTYILLSCNANAVGVDIDVDINTIEDAIEVLIISCRDNNIDVVSGGSFVDCSVDTSHREDSNLVESFVEYSDFRYRQDLLLVKNALLLDKANINSSERGIYADMVDIFGYKERDERRAHSKYVERQLVLARWQRIP